MRHPNKLVAIYNALNFNNVFNLSSKSDEVGTTIVRKLGTEIVNSIVGKGKKK